MNRFKAKLFQAAFTLFVLTFVGQLLVLELNRLAPLAPLLVVITILIVVYRLVWRR